MNMKKIIALDLDGVLCGLKVVDVASELLGFNHKEEHSTDWNMMCYPEELRLKIIQFFSDPVVMCDKVKIIPESQKKVKEWFDKGYDLHIITARVPEIRFKTLEMLDTHYPEIKKIHFVNFNESKKDKLREINPDLFIDDNPDNVLTSMELGINTLMVSNKFTKYNHMTRHKVKYINNLMEVDF
jgi:deoxypyrimidine-specific 5' nucleotidase type C protein (NT5C)